MMTIGAKQLEILIWTVRVIVAVAMGASSPVNAKRLHYIEEDQNGAGRSNDCTTRDIRLDHFKALYGAEH